MIKIYNLKRKNGKVLKIVAVNTIVCDTMNLHLMEDQTMAIRQLATLKKLLQRKG